MAMYPLTQEGPPPGPQETYVDNPVGTLPAGSALYQQGGPQPYPMYQHAWFNPLEMQGHQLQLMGGLQTVADAYGLRPVLENLYGTAISSMTGAMEGGGIPPQNPYSTGAIMAATDRMTGDILQNIMPRTDLAAAGANQVGSSRHGVLQANAMRQGQQAAAQAASEALSRDYNSWLNAWGQGQNQLARAWSIVPGLFSGLESAYLNPGRLTTGLGGLFQGVGGQYRDLSNQFLGDTANQWTATQQQPYENLDWYSDIVSDVPGGPGTQQTTTPGPSTLANALGGASLGYGLYQQFGSPAGNYYTNPGNPWGTQGAYNPLPGPWYNPMG